MNGNDKDSFNFSPVDLNFDLSLEDTLAQRQRGLAVTPKKPVVSGYNPYDRGNAARRAPPPEQPPRKPTDLRKLSEWIRLQRQVEQLKKEDPE